MLGGLNSRSMHQRTCLIVFQTCHTAEPRRSTYAQLAPYNIRKSPLFTKHVVRLMSEHDFFCVAQAALGLLKPTQPGIVDHWSFQILQCVAVKTSQFGQNSGHPFVWQVMRLRPVTTIAAALPLSCPFPGTRHGARNQPKQAQVRKPTPQLYSTAYNNNSFHVPDVWVVSCVRIIVLSYAGNNLVVRGPKHRLLPAYDGVIASVRHTNNKRA